MIEHSGNNYTFDAEGRIATAAAEPYPQSQIRNLYFDSKLAYRMGFTDSFYPSLLIMPDQIGSSRATVGLINGAGSPGPIGPNNFLTSTTLENGGKLPGVSP